MSVPRLEPAPGIVPVGADGASGGGLPRDKQTLAGATGNSADSEAVSIAVESAKRAAEEEAAGKTAKKLRAQAS